MLSMLDRNLFLFLNGLHQDWVDTFFTFLTDFGHFKIPLVLLVLLAFWKGNRYVKLGIGLALLVVAYSDLTGAAFKEIFARPRPFHVLEEARVLVGRSSSFSMPSNHSANMFSACVFLALWFRSRKWLVAGLLLLAGLVGYSRVHVGVHYPGDVLAGAFLGALCGGGVFWMQRRIPAVYLSAERRWRWQPLNAVFWLLLFVTVYRLAYIISPDHLLAAEEAQYWEWSRNLALSYYSKPPLIALLIKSGTLVFGHTELGVRIWAVLCTLGLAMVSWAFVWEVTRSEKAIFYTLGFMCFLPLYAVGSIILTTDTPLLFFWGASLYAIYGAVFQGRDRWWYAAGVFIGLGMLSKYAMVYLFPCMALFFLLCPAYRGVLKRKEPWLASGIVGLLFIPVVWWNVQNQFAAFRHVGGQVATKEGFALRLDTFFEFFGSQAAVITPVFFGAMLYAMYQVIRNERSRRDGVVMLLWSTSAPILLLILLKSFLGKVQANWAAPAYYTGTILTVLYFYRAWLDARGTRKARRIAIWAVVGFVIPFGGTIFIYNPGVMRSEETVRLVEGGVEWLRKGVSVFSREAAEDIEAPHPSRLDLEWRLTGWDRLAEKVDKVRRLMPRPEETFIITERYQTAALLAFYLPDHPRVYCINFGRRMNQYDFWPDPGEAQKGMDAVFVTLDDKKWEKYHRRMGKSFERTGKTRIVRIKRGGHVYHSYAVSACYGYGGRLLDDEEPESY